MSQTSPIIRRNHRLTYIIIALCAAIVILLLILTNGTWLHLGTEEQDKPTPVLIDKIRAIGQWEFLSIDDEEYVDTIRKGIFSDDELSRIYYGTLRLGIDLTEMSNGSIKKQADTLFVALPKVKLLDDDFIDEAKTRSLVEDGKWDAQDKAKLTKKADAMMRHRCLTPENYATARNNAKQSLTTYLQALGYPNVKITIATE